MATLLAPGDEGYEQARWTWNAMFDKRPALIARCSGVADVIAGVNFARENGMLLSVRGGGHSVPGHSTCDDGRRARPVADAQRSRRSRADDGTR